MAKTRQYKEDAAKKITATIKDSKAVVFANIQGLTVVELQDLKKKGKEKGVQGTLAKKTLLKRALKENNIDVDPKTFEGGIGMFSSSEDEISPAKTVAEFAKTHSVVSIFGGMFEGRYIDAAEVMQLSTIPSREELLSKLVGTINNPVRGFVTVLAGTTRGFVTVLDAIAKQKA